MEFIRKYSQKKKTKQTVGKWTNETSKGEKPNESLMPRKVLAEDN